MKTLFLLPILLLVGCAATKRTADKNGNFNWNIQGNYAVLDINDRGKSGFTLHGEEVDHATATLAQGQAAAKVIGATGTAVTSTVVASSNAGFFTKLFGTAAPVVSTAATSTKATPAKATPAKSSSKK